MPPSIYTSPIDVRTRVVALALEPAVALARLAGLTLDDLVTLVSVGYYQQFRDRGQSIAQTARKIGKSERTVSSLAKAAQEIGALLGKSKVMQARRLVLSAVAESGANGLSAEAIRSSTSLSGEAVALAIADLVDQKLLDRESERLVLSNTVSQLTNDELETRLDGLRHYFETSVQLIYQRFFAPSSSNAYARILSFKAVPSSLAELGEEVFELLKTRSETLDAKANPDAERSVLLFGYASVIDALVRGKR